MAETHPIAESNAPIPYMDYIDVVKSQGAHLLPPPPTPIFERQDVEKFATELSKHLGWLVEDLETRRKVYGDAIDEWPAGHVPLEIVEEHDAYINRLLEAFAAPSPPPGWDDDVKDDVEGDRQQKVRASWRRRLHWFEHHYIPTPSTSDFEGTSKPAPSCDQSLCPLLKTATSTAKNGKKRLLDSAEDEGPAKKSQKIAAELDNTVTDTATLEGGKSKKRRLDSAEDEGQAKKSRKIVAEPDNTVADTAILEGGNSKKRRLDSVEDESQAIKSRKIVAEPDNIVADTAIIEGGKSNLMMWRRVGTKIVGLFWPRPDRAQRRVRLHRIPG